MDVTTDELATWFGLGVAGNFAGHLEQAGEDADFRHVVAVEEAPKGVFPWFVPGGSTFLGTFPLSTDRLRRPPGDVRLQIEPEVGVVCHAEYEGDLVVALRPRALGAFNDCSIRREGARRISEKKNWGPASKGVAPTLMPVDDLDPEGPVGRLRLASLLRRDGRSDAYGVDSPLPGYSYFGEQLLHWLVDRFAHQRGTDDTPLEDVGALLVEAGRPSTLLVGIGATRYTDLGASTFLEPGDEAVVVVYDGTTHDPREVEEAVAAGAETGLDGASVLVQRVVAADEPADV